ncbi:hypothetical protein [Streptomyces sp. NPDC048650]|uniref:hypothetical protein n=1 Tax=unclassified Streptomyces TaxID=2593676 RepID=UPI00370F7671
MTTALGRQVRRFPPEPVRAVFVKIVCQTTCSGSLAIITMDFEPLGEETGGPVVFRWPERDRHQNRDPRRDRGIPREWLPQEFVEALEQGVRTALDALPPGVRPFVRCTVTDARWHEVDSSESDFIRAGEMAVEKALRLSPTATADPELP